jgi:FG-GAP-like repeat
MQFSFRFGIHLAFSLFLLIFTGCNKSKTTIVSGSGGSPAGFQLTSAVSTGNTGVLVTFSDPVGKGADDPANYDIQGSDPESPAFLQVESVTIPSQAEGTLTAEANQVILTTRSQSPIGYTLTVTNVFDKGLNPLIPEASSAQINGTPPEGTGLDTDGDGLTDDLEQKGWTITVFLMDGVIQTRGVTSNPAVADTDEDGLLDGAERTHGLDPRAADTDSDGLTDSDEVGVFFSSATKQDTDADLISDADEVNRNHTSPILADTDGDNFTDYDEIFDRSSNPLIADIPQVNLELVGDLDIRLNIEYEDGSTYATTDDTHLETESTSEESTKENLVGRTIIKNYNTAKNYITSQFPGAGGVLAQPLLGNDFGVEPKNAIIGVASQPKVVAELVAAAGSVASGAGKAGGFLTSNLPEWTTTSTDRVKNESAHQVQQSTTHTEKSSTGSIGLGLKIRNTGDVAFTLTNLVVTLLQRDPVTRDSFKALSTLSLPVDGVTLGPFNGETGVIRIDNAEASATLVKDLLANPTGLYLDVGTFDLLDAYGRNFAFLNEVTSARTALVMIDFGNGRVDRVHVATDVKRNPDGTSAGVTMGEVMGTLLGLDYETAPRKDVDEGPVPEVLVRVEDQRNLEDGTSFWFMMASSERLVAPETSFDDVVLHGGDIFTLAYVTDVDGDKLFAREEFMYGTKDSDPDTDGDGLTDFEEVKVGWLVDTGDVHRVYSDPLSSDRDRDGYTDLEERDRAVTIAGSGPTDPNNPDTDGDGLCDGPGRLDNPYNDPDALYYECRLGAPMDLKPLEPALTTAPNLIVVVPLPNDQKADPNTDILAKFTQKMDAGSTFSLFGSMTGSPSGAFSLLDNSTLNFNPDASFFPGETVEVILNDTLRNIDNFAFDFFPDIPGTQPYVYRFRTKVVNTGSNGTFGYRYPAGNGPQRTVSTDLDGDGDKDLAVANSGSDNVSILINNGNRTFAAAVNFPVGSHPWGITAADLDGDNDPDLAVANSDSDNVSILINNGNGTFSAAVNYATEDQPYGVSSADVDHDGDMDLVTANSGAAQSVTVLLNNGDGTFTAGASYPAGSNPWGVAAANLNGDVYPDLAVANTGNDKVSVLINNGDGTFAAFVPYDTVFAPVEVIAADLDGVNGLDLVVGGESSYVTVHLNNGDGTFAAGVNYAAGIQPFSLIAADLDGDNDLDLASALTIDDDVAVLLNNGNGTFAPPQLNHTGGNPFGITAADFDADGSVDLATTSNALGEVWVLFNNGDGGFSDYPVGDSPYSVTAADLDADGDLDLASADFNSDNVSVLLNNGNGTFSAAVNYLAGDGAVSVMAADLDGDGDLDLATANQNSDNASVLLNNGDGTFAAAVNYTAGDSPGGVTSADLDGDGDLDLATANNISDNVSVLLNNGNGNFPAPVNYAAGNCPARITAADFDGDGDLDLAPANICSNDVSVLMNNGDGTFAAAVNYAAGNSPYGVAAADLDGDGDLDLATANFVSDNVSVLLNHGDGTFAAAINYAAGDGPERIALADLDGDGDLDLATTNFNSGNVSVLSNNGNGTFSAAVNHPAGHSPVGFVAADLDGDGDLDLAASHPSTDRVSVLFKVIP